MEAVVLEDAAAGAGAGAGALGGGRVYVRVRNSRAMCGVTWQAGVPAEGSPASGELCVQVSCTALGAASASAAAAASVAVAAAEGEKERKDVAVRAGDLYFRRRWLLHAQQGALSRQRQEAAAQQLEEELTGILARAGVLDLSQLCIESGKLAWKLVCDVEVLSVDTHVQDAAMAALVLALQHTSVPAFRIAKDTGELIVLAGDCSAEADDGDVSSSRVQPSVPLVLQRCPLVFTVIMPCGTPVDDVTTLARRNAISERFAVVHICLSEDDLLCGTSAFCIPASNRRSTVMHGDCSDNDAKDAATDEVALLSPRTIRQAVDVALPVVARMRECLTRDTVRL